MFLFNMKLKFRFDIEWTKECDENLFTWLTCNSIYLLWLNLNEINCKIKKIKYKTTRRIKISNIQKIWYFSAVVLLKKKHQ